MTGSPSRAELEQEVERGIAALRRGDNDAARQALERVAQSGSASPQLWFLLAQACGGVGDSAGVHSALDQVLAAEPRNLYALLGKGELYLREGDDRAAVSFLRMALSSAAAARDLPADLRQRLGSAQAAAARLDEKFERHLAEQLADAGVTDLPPRFGEALEIASGRREIYLQQPTSFYFPGLPQIAWYDPAQFDWVAEFEARVPEMRAEVENVLSDGAGIAPYVERQGDRASRGHSLLGDERWSAFYLWKDGARVDENAARCPVTMELLELPPIPRIDGRSPIAMISILEPGTHIEPHTGMLNTRLICHVPLIVPPGCRLRVGGETRAVETGKTMIFDDSIEHEAWNNGGATRAVLLFEIWRPEIDEAERAALTAMFQAIGGYPSGH